MKNKNKLWYIKQKGQTTGPFPSQVVSNNIVLGRLKMHDQASADNRNWLPIEQITELHPEQGIDIQTNMTLDERSGFDRRQTQLGEPAKQARKGDRRSPEDPDLLRRRRFHTMLMNKFREQKSPIFWPLFAVAVVLTSIAGSAIYAPTLLPVSQIDCNAPAQMAVNWNNCLKPKQQLAGTTMNNAQMRSARMSRSNFASATLTQADMAYADLSFSNLNNAQLHYANLVGADLSHSNLSGADLNRADLSYANLLDADLTNTKLENVSLDHAVWTNGQICKSPSIGRCLLD